MKLSLVIVAMLCLLLALPTVFGLSISGLKLSPLDYRPGLTLTNHYLISDTDKQVNVTISGSGVFHHLRTTPVINNEFDLILDFPAAEKVPQGQYTITLTVVEIPKPEEGVSATATISKRIDIVVYSYEKDLRATLIAPNINVGGNVTFSLNLQSYTYSNISSVQGLITVYDAENKKVGSVATKSVPLPALEGTALSAWFDASKLPAAKYGASALVSFDGKEKQVNTTFLIGSMDVIVKSYTPELEPEFAEFSVKVANNWGNRLRNVYAKLYINEQELLHTPSIDLEPWQEGELKGIVKVDLPPGQYQALLKLFFEGASKEVQLPIMVVSPPELEKEISDSRKEQQPQPVLSFSLTTLLITAGLALIIMITLAFLLFRKRRRGVGHEF